MFGIRLIIYMKTLSAISLSLIFIPAMQPNENPSQSLRGAELHNQHPEDLIRQEYTIRASGGQTFVVPTAIRDETLPLAKVLKPDFSKAMEVAPGVRVVLVRMPPSFDVLCLFLPLSL